MYYIILQRIKEGYLLWINIVPHIPKSSRYAIGVRIENKFLDLLEMAYIAYYAKREIKIDKISECIFLLDTLKFIFTVTWDAKLISSRQFEEVALKLEEIGRMLGGWKGDIENPDKKNRAL